MLQIPASVISSVGAVSLSLSLLNSPESTAKTSFSKMANPSAHQNYQRSAAPANANQPPAANSTMQTAVRKLPKKRKYDPSGLEELEKSCTNNNGLVSAPTGGEFQHKEQLGGRDRIGEGTSPTSLHVSTYPPVNLADWRNHRVLAKHGGLYLPGVIKRADRGRVTVELDGRGSELVTFDDVFGVGKFDVIGDASPSVDSVVPGSRCVVRTTDRDNSVHNIFVEGVVVKVYSSPIHFRVKVFSF